MTTPNKPKLVIPDDLFDSPDRDVKVDAVKKLVNKEPNRVALVIRMMLNRDNKWTK
jgi:flagellar biosynthesis/type III secretory pathway M-ring protein FliF/YscJ